MLAGATDQQDPRALSERLRGRRDEIEQTLLTRVYAISDPAEVGDSEYALGLKTAVGAALDYALDSLDRSEAARPSLPPELLTQARAAARAGVSLDTVLRRYIAGHTALGDFVAQETLAAAPGDDTAGQASLRAQAALLDHLIDAVACEYNSELRAQSRSRGHRSVECVKKLLAGELVDTSGLDYDLNGWHLGAVASGLEADLALRKLADELDRLLLIVPMGPEIAWAWLGGTRRPAQDKLDRLNQAAPPPGVCVALGEPASGLVGWRQTHRQAAAALPVVQRGSAPVVRYSEVAMLATILQDDLLIESLREVYLEPLARERDGGETLRNTLRAYFEAECNSSAAAAALGIARQTVKSRLRTVESYLGRSVSSCSSELRAALCVEEFESSPSEEVPPCERSDREPTTSQERGSSAPIRLR